MNKNLYRICRPGLPDNTLSLAAQRQAYPDRVAPDWTIRPVGGTVIAPEGQMEAGCVAGDGTPEGEEMSEQTLTVSQDHYLLPAMSMSQAIFRYQGMVKFVQELMKRDIDYGTIPNTPKPTLYKAGAERLCTYFGMTPTFSVVEKVEDWDGRDHGGEPFFYYWYRCHVRRGEHLLAEADGSCNSQESKYRWRWVTEDDLPPGIDKAMLKKRGGSLVEFAFAVDKAETSGKYGKPAEYWLHFSKLSKPHSPKD